MNDRDEIKVCPKCNRKYIYRFTTYPSKVDDKRVTYITCPYCNEVIESDIHLRGNEDVATLPLK